MSDRIKATAGMVIGSGGYCRLSFQQWPPPPITIPVVALNSDSGGELKLYLSWKRNTTYTPFVHFRTLK